MLGLRVGSKYDKKNLKAFKSFHFYAAQEFPMTRWRLLSDVVEKHNNTEGFRFLYVGSFIKRKHLDKVIDAFGKFCKKRNDRKSVLTIVGGGPEKEEMERCVEGSWAKAQITLIGRQERMEVLQHMKKAHIFTLISDTETYGMVYMEAMLQGCLVIASKGGRF